MTTITTPRSAHPGVLYRLSIDTRYLLLSFPAGVASFVVIVTGLSLGVGLLITVLGLLILAGTLRMAGRFAALERLQIAGILGTPPAESSFRTALDPSGTVKRLLTVVTDPRRLRETAHGLLRFPVAVGIFSIGLLAALALPWIMHGLVVVKANLGKALLSSHLRPDELAPAVQAPSRSWS